MRSYDSASSGSFAQELVRKAVSAGADAAQVLLDSSRRFEIDADTRAVNLVRTVVAEDTTLTVFKGGRKGTASLSGRHTPQIEATVQLALATADAGLVDDANRVAAANGGSPTRHGPEDCDAMAMLESVRDHVRYVSDRFPRIRIRHCIYSFNDTDRHFASSAGVRCEERRAMYRLGVMFAAKDGSRTTSFNYSGCSSYSPFTEIIEADSVRRLMEQTLQSFDARPVPEKFVGDVIVTPECLYSMIGHLAAALGGYALLAETTPYRGKMGGRIAAKGFSLYNRPRDETLADGADFDDFGVATRNLAIIENGILQNFLVDFYIASKLNMAQTAGRTNFVVAPGEASLNEILAATERGILLARFSGGRPNDKLDFSGIAKNSFYVEDGKIKYPLAETMVSGNFQVLLENIRELSRESVNFGGGCFPYLAAGGVTISGK